MQEGIQEVITNKIKFEPYGDLVDQASSKFNENLLNNKDPQSQIENHETPWAVYPNKNDSEETETNKHYAIPNFMPKILPDDEITQDINSLTSTQREFFNVVHTWAKDYVNYYGHNVGPVHIFLSGSRGKGNSHLVKVIYCTISKTLLFHCKDPEKLSVLLRGPIGISAVNIGGTTFHSSLGIKPETKLLGLKFKADKF